MLKNTASQSVMLFAFDITSGAAKTGDSANMVFYVTKDFGTVTAIAASSGVPIEVDSTNAKGWYKIALSQSETNADNLQFTGKSSTANISVVGRPVDTFPANFTAASIDSNGRVDVIKIAGTTQTARDVGASVLLSTGTGTGQLDFTSGVVKANLAQILGTALTETSGQIAAGFKKFFNIASPAATMDHGILVDTVTTATTATALTTNNDKTGYAIASGGIGSGAHAAAELNNIADGCLDRRLDLGTDSGGNTTTSRTWRQALFGLRNKATIIAGTGTIYKCNDTTVSHTMAMGTTPGDPLSSQDPA